MEFVILMWQNVKRKKKKCYAYFWKAYIFAVMVIPDNAPSWEVVLDYTANLILFWSSLSYSLCNQLL